MHEPFRSHEALQLQHSHTDGPFPFLNPTQAHFRHAPPSNGTGSERTGSADSPDISPSTIEFQWRSRDNRKGRHTLLTDTRSEHAAQVEKPPRTATWRATGRGILRMALVYPYWDISYLVAIIFTLGSVVWVVNSFFVFLPLPAPSTEFDDEILTAGGVTAFIGATIFEVGSVLLMLEAMNEERSGCFGWAVEKALKDHEIGGSHYTIKPDLGGCAHHHPNKKNLVGKGDGNYSDKESNKTGGGRSWTWFPSTYELKTHYLREIGFLACLFQFLGATIFWISGFTALPGVNNEMSQGLLDGLFWTPQVIGGSGFIVSG
ncbi:MAG: hypothetical protein L6R39_006433 [Caloplaca ligustica]|nr:MAG: hypothetical protein L6R39_006433 [Caloplaca ligustica]